VLGEPVVVVAGEDEPPLPADGESDGDELVEVLEDGLGLVTEVDGVGVCETDVLGDGCMLGGADDFDGFVQLGPPLVRPLLGPVFGWLA
jgi:hypothetical protein